MHFRIQPRLEAAILYLLAAFFLGSIIFMFAFVGERVGLAALFEIESPVRIISVFLLTAGVFSLAVSLLLFSSVALSQSQRLGLLIIASIQMLAGLFIASISVTVTLLPLWFLLRFYKESRA
jgi:hypothetical protein